MEKREHEVLQEDVQQEEASRWEDWHKAEAQYLGNLLEETREKGQRYLQEEDSSSLPRSGEREAHESVG